MSSRIVWFVAGTAAGVYTSVKARRAAYRLSAPGVVDQAAALGLGWRELSAEMREGMRAREEQVARRLSELPPPASFPDSTPPDVTPPDLRAT
jgi:hypothetical protein